MQDKPSGAGDERAKTAAEDLQAQRVVLNEILFNYPETPKLDELVRELTIASTEFSESDKVERAVRDLIAGGLLHRVDALVLPTRAAVIFHDLHEA